MWFKRKPKNRRLGREYVLDVKLRSSQVRAARTRMAAVTLGIVFATVFGVYLLWHTGEWILNELVYENKEFAIQEIDVQTDGVLSADQLRRWAGVRQGQNLLALDLGQVKRDLELVSVVQSVAIERIPPRTLRIRVIEREPMAQINMPTPRPGGGIEMGVFHLDAEGHVMLPLDPHQRAASVPQIPEPLPVIIGLNGNQVQAGRRIESTQVLAALQLLRAFENSPMEGLVDLKHIDVSSPEVLIVTTGQGSEITFGLTDLEQQLRRWQIIYEMGQRQGKAIASLDLAVINNIPARWLEASAVPTETPKPTKPSRNRKKHV
ncbi:MAG TPA: FtsQ-type POTRA domain-containing protein [Clostridia bacterium]|nr:FtsQ-type POTRA domain-containing protein [Clostridia bacterium]